MNGFLVVARYDVRDKPLSFHRTYDEARVAAEEVGRNPRLMGVCWNWDNTGAPNWLEIIEFVDGMAVGIRGPSICDTEMSDDDPDDAPSLAAV